MITPPRHRRGHSRFVPRVQGRGGRCPQLPTTLPTLDEVIGIDGVTVATAHAPLLAQTQRLRAGHVFTLHAQLEGMKLLPVLPRLLQGWRERRYTLVAMRTVLAGLDRAQLPLGSVDIGSVAGRSGTLAVQGAA